MLLRFFNSILVSILQGEGVLWANDMSKSCFFKRDKYEERKCKYRV